MTAAGAWREPRWRVAAFLAAAAALNYADRAAISSLAKSESGPLVEVWKSPDCGCCKDWIAHLEANGFRTRTHDNGNTDAPATATRHG